MSRGSSTTRAVVAVAAALALGVALSGARASPGAAGAVSLTGDSSQPVRRAPRPPGAAAGQTPLDCDELANTGTSELGAKGGQRLGLRRWV